jgi:hypothetical protein
MRRAHYSSANIIRQDIFGLLLFYNNLVKIGGVLESESLGSLALLSLQKDAGSNLAFHKWNSTSALSSVLVII